MPHVWILDFLEQQLPLLSCFLSKEIKTFGKQNSFHLEDEVKTPGISIWISWVFLCGFPLHIFSNFHYSAIRADAANHHRVDIHSLMWKSRLVKWKFGEKWTNSQIFKKHFRTVWFLIHLQINGLEALELFIKDQSSSFSLILGAGFGMIFISRLSVWSFRISAADLERQWVLFVRMEISSPVIGSFSSQIYLAFASIWLYIVNMQQGQAYICTKRNLSTFLCV